MANLREPCKSTMNLRFLGTGAAFNPALGNNAACFIHKDRLYLIDCGESVFAAVLRARLFEETKGEVTVLLTHTHSDHCGSLGTFCLYVYERLNRPVAVISPDESVRTLLALMGVGEGKYRLLSSLEEDGLSVKPIPVRHLSMTAFAYRIDDGKEVIYYSGDASELPSATLDALRAGRLARIYQDTMAFPGEPPANPPHMPLATLEALVEPALRARVCVMHYNCDFRAEAAAMGFACAVRDPAFE